MNNISKWSNKPVDFLDIPLDFPYSSGEWDQIFKALIGLLDRKEYQIIKRAIKKLIDALEIEGTQYSNCDDYQPKPTDERAKGIFEAINTRVVYEPSIFEMFCSSLKFLVKDLSYRSLVLQWLEELAASEDRFAPTQDVILAAQIFIGAYDSSWEEVGRFLIELLDHADLNVRACAAYQIGKFFSKATHSKNEVWEWVCDNNKYERDKQTVVGFPSLEIIMQLIRNKEIERPGVAGAFWDVIPKKNINAKKWLLDILENSPEPEPYIPYFVCDLAFDAHERFSQDADAIRCLIDMGRVYIAIAAATDQPCKIPALESLLVEMGNDYDDPEIIRLASWHLAYHYHYLHPRGAERGYVELVDNLSEIDLFLLFSDSFRLESLYAVVIYPKVTEQKFNREIAQSWVGRIFPDTIRGQPIKDLPSSDESHFWYQRGYIKYYFSTEDVGCELIDNVVIGYRSDFYWNPKEFL